MPSVSSSIAQASVPVVPRLGGRGLLRDRCPRCRRLLFFKHQKLAHPRRGAHHDARRVNREHPRTVHVRALAVEHRLSVARTSDCGKRPVRGDRAHHRADEPQLARTLWRWPVRVPVVDGLPVLAERNLGERLGGEVAARRIEDVPSEDRRGIALAEKWRRGRRETFPGRLRGNGIGREQFRRQRRGSFPAPGRKRKGPALRERSQPRTVFVVELPPLLSRATTVPNSNR